MISYIIIDDEHIAHDIIKKYGDMLPHMQLMTQCYDAIEALEYLSKHKVDLIFLDLNMPKLKGFDFLKTLSNPPKVIVTTAYSEFAIESYELNVVDYLLKPFGFERFLKAINKVIEAPTPIKSIHTETNKTLEDKIFFKQKKSHIQITLKDILYIEASGNYCKVFTNNETITIREKISDIIASLPKKEFLQVHKSFAIATNHISSIEGNRISLGKIIIPVGKMYKAGINDFLG